MENKKEQLLSQREQLMGGICEMLLNKLNMEQALDDLKSRMKLTLQDLMNNTNELNRVLEEEKKEVE